VRRVLVVATVGLGALSLAGLAASKVVTVGIAAGGFLPAELSIGVGDTVTWENRDSADHQVVSRQAGFSSPVLKAGQTFSHTFAHAGRFQVNDPVPKKALRMTVTVSSPSISVSLLSVASQVVYGGRVALTGIAAGGRAGDQVAIWARPCRAATPVKATAVIAAPGGAFTATVQPLRNTRYTAEVGSSASSEVSVSVRPRLTLRKVATGRFTVVLRGSTSFSGRAVVLQRWNGSLRKWVNIRSALLVRAAGGTPPTVLSRSSFRAPVRAGSRLRVTISRFQAGGCYRPSWSNVVLA
jgi:plastocyanin